MDSEVLARLQRLEADMQRLVYMVEKLYALHYHDQPSRYGAVNTPNQNRFWVSDQPTPC